MAAQGGPNASEIIAVISSSFTLNCVEFPVPTFLVYEYLITLDQEIRLFWKRGFTGASALFLFVRYSTLLCYAILGTITFAPLSDTSCALLTKAQAAFTMFQYIPWALFSALRVLALSGMNWPLAIVVFLLACAPAATNFTQYSFGLTGVNDPLTGCQGHITATQHQVEILVVVSRAGLILADFIGVVVTIVKTRKAVGMPLSRGSGRSLGHVLLYDGVMYFAALLCFNVVDLALSVIAFVTPVNSGNYVTALTDPLTAVLVCRFLLDLQDANIASVHPGTHSFELSEATIDGAGSLVFARVIGSMGASLGPDRPETDSLEESDVTCSVAASGACAEAGDVRERGVYAMRELEGVPAS